MTLKIVIILLLLIMLPPDEMQTEPKATPFEKCQLVYDRFPEQCSGYKDQLTNKEVSDAR